MTGNDDRLDERRQVEDAIARGRLSGHVTRAAQIEDAVLPSIRELRDARAEIERLNLVVAAMDSQADENITEVLALTADRDHWRTEWEDADAKRITAEAELAAERAKVQRLAQLVADWADQEPDEPCHELWAAARAALRRGDDR